MPNKTHDVATGDTFDLISSRHFGEPGQAGRIRKANPGALEPLVTGTTLIIPSDAAEGLGTEADGLVVRIGGVAFSHIKEIAITRHVDAVDTVEIQAPLAETEQFDELIVPLSYHQLEVADRGVRLFRGTLVPVKPKLTTEGSLVRLGGYSLPGVLSDCTVPSSSEERQFRNLNLHDIASKLVEPFSITVVRDGDVGGPFKRVKIKRDEKIMSFLAGLANERQIFIRSNAEGEMVLAGPPPLGNPVADLKQDRPPVISLEPEFAPQNYFSHITGVRVTRRGRPGGSHTVLNPLAQEAGIFRPLTISIRDVTSGDLPKATAAAAGRMLAGAVTYAMKVATWYDPDGVAWAPGSTLQLEAPSVFVKRPYQFQIRSVKLSRNMDRDVATLLLMLPGALGGTAPSVLPWT